MNAVNQLKFLDWLQRKFGGSTGLPPFLFLLSLFVTGCGEKTAPAGDTPGSGDKGTAIVADWPLFRGDPEMQGVAVEVIEPPLELAWTYEPEAEEGKRLPPIEASPVIVGGVVFVGTQGGEFLAIHLESGELKWKFDAEGPVTAPAAATEKAVFFGDQYGFVYALQADTGEEIWRFETEGKIEGGVNLLTDNSGKTSVYIGSHDYCLYSFDSETGEVQWKYETDNYIVATPSLVNSGGSQSVCFGGCDGLLHILPSNGEAIDETKTEVEIGSYVANSAAVRDGIAYVAHNDGEIIAIDVSAREEVWRIVTNTKYLASPAVDDTSLYVSGPDKRLVAYDRVTGEEKWSFLATRSLDSSPVISGDVIWQGGMDGRLYAVNRADGSELWQFELGAQIKASPAVSRGTLVVCGSDGVVYAFR